MFVAFFYLIYRYIFKYNMGAGGWYSSTPSILLAGKYIIYGILLSTAFPIIFMKNKLIKVNDYTMFIKITILIIAFIGHYIINGAGNFGNLKLLLFFIFILPLFIMPINRRININDMNKFISMVIIAYILFEFYQIISFILFGQVPSHSHVSQVIPGITTAGRQIINIGLRWGSIVDDPNTFGQLIALFLGFSFYYYKGIKRNVVIITLTLFWFMTQSGTAIISVPLSIIILTIMSRNTISKLRGILVILLILFIIGFVIYANKEYVSIMMKIYYSKMPSALGHIEGYKTHIKFINVYSIIGINPVSGGSESDILNIFAKYGIIITALYMLLFFNVFSRCMKIIKNRDITDQSKALHTGIAMFSISVLIGSSNLSFSRIFPINALFAIFLFLSNREIWKFNRNTIHI